MTETLPNPLPVNPLTLAAAWLDQARIEAIQPNPNAMMLATVDQRGQPSARVVLCKSIAVEGWLVFYTNYQSRKGRELAVNPRAAALFHWDYRHRQIRIEGRVEMLSDAENDAYFSSRPWQSRLGAWASRQSEPIASREALVDAVAKAAERFGIPYTGSDSAEPAGSNPELPRPANWGGYRLHAEAVELWVEGEFRIHDRARWTRSEGHADGGEVAWSATRLQP